MKFIYGKHAIEELLKKFPNLALKLYYTRREKLEELNLKDLKIEKFEINSESLRRKFNLKEFESPQGLLLELKEDINNYLKTSPEELILNACETNKNLILITNINDNHNLGAIARSCAVFNNVAGIIYSIESPARLIPSTAKISAGGIFHLKFAEFKNLKNLIKAINSSGMEILCFENRQESVPLKLWKEQNKEKSPYIFIFGAEDIGIPREIQQTKHQSIKIEQNSNFDSLNLSVATGITLYEFL